MSNSLGGFLKLLQIVVKSGILVLEILVKYMNRRSIFVGSVMILFLVVLLGYFFFVPKISLNGSDVIRISWKTRYEEKGYKGSYFFRDQTKRVKVKGKVDSEKVGTYIITYHLDSGMFHTRVKRRVEVVDLEKPVITLVGSEEVVICPSSIYQEEGYQAIDEYDGDLTDKVERIEGDDEIKYKVHDSSHNVQIASRKIKREDVTPPTITLNGSSYVYQVVGSTYQEQGVTVLDNCDDSLSSKVQIMSDVDTSKEGIYTVTYTVSDRSGNVSSVSRKVEVVSLKSGEGIIYLTFDDGPSATITSSILDILKEEGVKATFFVLDKSDSLNYLIKRAYDEGHTIALHSATHSYGMVYSSVDAYFQDLYQIQEKVQRITGEKSMIIRFPGGSSNTVSRRYCPGIMRILTSEVLNRGFHYFDWNVGSGDAGGSNTKEEVYSSVVSSLRYDRRNVVLMHDFENNYKTRDALQDIIRFGKANGYTFLPIDYSTPMVRHAVSN